MPFIGNGFTFAAGTVLRLWRAGRADPAGSHGHGKPIRAMADDVRGGAVSAMAMAMAMVMAMAMPAAEPQRRALLQPAGR